MSKEIDLAQIALPSVKFKTEKVKYKGGIFEVRQPSRKVRKELTSRCKDENGNMDIMDFITWSVIYCTYNPETNERVFSDEHYDSIMAQPTGGILDKLGEVAANLMNIEKDIGEAIKN